MDTTRPLKSNPVACPLPNCGAAIEQKGGPGRIKLYCKPSHGEQWRRRMAAFGWL